MTPLETQVLQALSDLLGPRDQVVTSPRELTASERLKDATTIQVAATLKRLEKQGLIRSTMVARGRMYWVCK